MSLLPLFLDLRGKAVLLVGGGSTARAKWEALRPTGARVKAVALRFGPGFEGASLVREVRAFRPSDLDGVVLAISATDRPEVNAQVAAEARARGIWVVSVDDPPRCDAFFASTLRRGPWTVALSTEGGFPGLSRVLRQVLEELLPPGQEALAQELCQVRRELRRRLPDPEARGRVLRALLEDVRTRYLLPEETP